MNYQEAREYLANASKKGIILGLKVMEELLERLGNPHRELTIVHIAGTNGKGSILAYIETVFLKAGYQTARYVSPALGAYENRFLLNGTGVEENKIPDLVSRVKEAAEQMEEETGLSPTLFELETAMAFLCFKEAKADLILLETGMGGKLDATNVAEHPWLSIIASVSMDHMHILGDTLSEIAMEKAGIIKEGCPVLLYPENDVQVKQVIEKVCQEKSAALYKPEIEEGLWVLEEGPDGSRFSYKEYDNLKIFLPGRHQIYNAVTAIEAIKLLKKHYIIEEKAIIEGLAQTKWSGRLEKIKEKPLVYIDGAHNRDAALRLREFLEKHFEKKRILAVTGVLADKEYDYMMSQILPLTSKTAVITPDNPRALAGAELLKTAKKYCRDCVDAGTIQEGYAWALAEAGWEDVVIIFGSLSFMDDLKTADVK